MNRGQIDVRGDVLFLYFQSTGGYVAEHLESLDSGAGDASSEPATTGEGNDPYTTATGDGDEPAAE